jgi:hypothetical protein
VLVESGEAGDADGDHDGSAGYPEGALDGGGGGRKPAPALDPGDPLVAAQNVRVSDRGEAPFRMLATH